MSNTLNTNMIQWHAMQARQEISEVTTAAQEAAHRDQHAHRHSTSNAELAGVREQARDALAALRSLSKLALRTSAAMQAAAASLEATSTAPSNQVCMAQLVLLPSACSQRESPTWELSQTCNTSTYLKGVTASDMTGSHKGVGDA